MHSLVSGRIGITHRLAAHGPRHPSSKG